LKNYFLGFSSGVVQVLLCLFFFCELFLSLGCEFQWLVTDPWKLGYSAFQRVGHYYKIDNGWSAGETLS